MDHEGSDFRFERVPEFSGLFSSDREADRKIAQEKLSLFVRSGKAQHIRRPGLSEVGLAQMLGLFCRDEGGSHVPRLLGADALAEYWDFLNISEDFAHYFQQGISLHSLRTMVTTVLDESYFGLA